MDERQLKANLAVLAFLAVALVVLGVPVFLVWWFVFRKKSSKYEDVSGESRTNIKNELVLCHAGYCGYCRDFLPEFEKAVPELQQRFPGLKIVAYKHETDMSEIQKIEPAVTYYPCMRLNGAEFEGPRTSQGVIDFVEKNYI